MAELAESPSYPWALKDALGLPRQTMYSALHRLEDWGLLSGRCDASTHPTRRVYKLTAAGRRALATGAAPQAR